MRILVILNGVSRKKKLFYRKIYPLLKAQLNPEIWETTYAGHAEALASKGVSEGFDVILSAGGDGTMHQVINGVMASEKPPMLGLIPLGSGNDLARALNAVADAQHIIDLIKKRQPVAVDIGLITSFDKDQQQVRRYFINECSMGMGPEVVRRVNEGARILGAGLMYLKSIVATFFLLEPQDIRVSAGDLTWSGRSRVLAIANGKAFGHGIYIAPNSTMVDGMLNLFIAGNPPLLRFLALLQTLKRPAESKDSCLTYGTASTIFVNSAKPLPVEADGELIGFSPLTCEVAVKKISVLC